MPRSSFSPSRRPHSGRAASRPWVLWCLLPMLWMSLLSQTLHPHELRSSAPMGAQRIALGAAFSAHDAPDALISAPLAQMCASQEACLLCQWASVAATLLVAATALALPATQVLAPRKAHSGLAMEAPLGLRSRAPPL